MYNIQWDRFHSGNFFIDEWMMRNWGCYLGHNYLSGMWIILLSRLLDTTEFVVISWLYTLRYKFTWVDRTNKLFMTWQPYFVQFKSSKEIFTWMWSSHQQNAPNSLFSLRIMFPQHWWWGYCENFNQGVTQITILFSFSKLTLNLHELSRCVSYQKWCM